MDLDYDVDFKSAPCKHTYTYTLLFFRVPASTFPWITAIPLSLYPPPRPLDLLVIHYKYRTNIIIIDDK